MAASKNRTSKNRTAKTRQGAVGQGPAPAQVRPPKELKPWQLAVFIVLGLLVAGAALGFGYAKKSHDEYGQWPWARTAIPPQMYYDKSNYDAAGTGSLTGMVTVGRTPGGGIIWAPSAVKKPAPTTIEVQKASGGEIRAYTLVAKS